MRIKVILILGISLGIGEIASAQSNVDDLIRYSGMQYQGTARATGAGNAFGAVGADFGAIGINPAGLGLYQGSEFSATLGFNSASTNGNYLSNNTSDNYFNPFIGNAGIVIANNKVKKGKDVSSGWLAVNWAIGYTRTNNFNSNTLIQGTNTNNSILTSYKEDANNQKTNPYGLGYGTYGGLAYATYLIDPYLNNPNNPYDSSNYVDRTRLDNSINVSQKDVIQTTGSTSNISLSVAGNYIGKLYLGATVNVPTVNFTSNKTFTEYNNNPSSGVDGQYISSSLNESLTTTGVGINVALGGIYKFNDMFRIGLSLQVPTIYSLTDVFSTTMIGNTAQAQPGEQYNGDVSVTASNPTGFQYTIVTPARATLSAAIFFAKNGFLSADYEYCDYSQARLNNSNGNNYSDINQSVQQTLQGVNTVRVGCEYRIDAFALRAGYNYISTPYKSGLTDANFGDTYNILSFGVGFRAKRMGLDLTYQVVTNYSTYTPYTISSPADIAQYSTAPSANITTTKGNLMLTYSTRF